MFTKLGIPAAVVCSFFFGTVASAQPALFADLGPVDVPAVPSSAQEFVDTSFAFDFGDGVNPGETLTVKWLRLDLLSPVFGDLYLDVSASLFDPPRDLSLALYDASGTLGAIGENTSGNGAFGGSLSFGSTAERTPPEFPFLLGQSGAALPAGEYWIAVAAGTPAEVTFGAAAWDVQTLAAYQLGFGDGETYLEVSIAVGNTTPLPPPFNDDCANAAQIGEDVGATPAFVGTLDGATEDGVSPCWANIPNVTFKDVWVNYTPTVTGWVQVVASGENDPILTMFSGGCGGSVDRCSGGGNFALAGGSRIAFFATAGQPVLFSVAGRAGATGTVRLNIDPFGPPCNLNTPIGATIEAEACGSADNDGCSIPGGAFGTIAPNEAIAGTLYNTTTPNNRDRDWYLLTLTESSTVTLAVRGQVPVESVILGPPQFVGACSGEQKVLARTANALAPCATAQNSVVLLPGTYFVAVAHLFADGIGCGSGYENYVLSVSSVPCEQPSVLTQPVNATGGLGCTVTYSGSMSGSTDVSYTWQWGQVLTQFDPPFTVWTDLFDGEFSDIFSLAQISGAFTDTLSISGIDDAMLNYSPQLRFRLKGELCAPSFTSEALFTAETAACERCNYDYNQDENVDLTDAQQMAQVAAGVILADPSWLDGDLNGDENADITDAQLLAAFVASGICGV